MIMEQEDKNILLRDLCGRLPYGVKVSYYDLDEEILKCDTLEGVERSFVTVDGFQWEITDIKPYLIPLSSMTEEQRIEASFEFGSKKYKVNIFGNIESYSEIGDDIAYIDLENIERYINWLNKNHFDYRGLIEKGLAIDATNLGIYK